MSNLKVLISGSGIAGSVFAFWLLRAYPKANITIVERAPSLRLTGASVDIRSSAVDIMKWMGVEEEVRKHTTKEQGVTYINGKGWEIGTLRSTGRTDIQTVTSEFEIFRGALAHTFIRPSLDRVNLIFDETVDTYEQHDGGVDVTFSKSKETKTYDLLVAADGLASKIRGRMLNAKPWDQVWEEGMHAAFFTINHDMLNGSRLAQWHNTSDGNGIFLRPDPNPAGRTRGHLMNITTDAEVEKRKRLNDALREGNESYKTLLEELFRDAGPPASAVLKAMRESDDFYCSLFAQVRSPKLQDGRVVLLGDAGYATPGIGTSLAIMGAYVLAGELLRNSGHVTTALQGYEGIMQPFVKHQQSDDKFIQYMHPRTWWGQGIRDVILGIVLRLNIIGFAIRIAAAFGFTEKKLDMPDYQWPAAKA